MLIPAYKPKETSKPRESDKADIIVRVRAGAPIHDYGLTRGARGSSWSLRPLWALRPWLPIVAIIPVAALMTFVATSMVNAVAFVAAFSAAMLVFTVARVALKMVAEALHAWPFTVASEVADAMAFKAVPEMPRKRMTVEPGFAHAVSGKMTTEGAVHAAEMPSEESTTAHVEAAHVHAAQVQPANMYTVATPPVSSCWGGGEGGSRA